MTRDRAKAIRAAAQALAEKSALGALGSWTDQLVNVMTPDERAEVKLVWDLMSGDSCFLDAFEEVLAGSNGVPWAFCIQAWSSVGGWMCSRYGGNTLEEAERAGQELVADDDAWMSGARRVRVVPYAERLVRRE